MTRERSATTFVVTLKPTVAGIDGIRALRATLKFALRRFGLKCVDAREILDQASPDDPIPLPQELPAVTRRR
jgi:hypothetical protein